MAQTHAVAAPDLRGFGDTEKPAAGYDKRTVARDIRELLARLGHRRAVIVGHDIGAQIAFRLALDAPDLVAKLVIVNGRYPPLGTALMYTPKHAPERWYSNKQLSFAGVKLITLAEGEISELHVGLKGTMNSLFLKDLAAKTWRGMEGRVRQGRSGGGLCYGYDVVQESDTSGTPVRGGRRINESEAAVVRRIFEAFAAGASPRAIARTLNAESVAGPRGRPWIDTTIRGHGPRGTGILRNELYIGRLVWNRLAYRKDPRTGKRVSRLNPPEDWIVEDVPELRIINQDLWDTVQTRLSAIRTSPGITKLRQSRFCEKRRPKHLLTGLVHCGACGKPMAAVGKDYLACAHARRNSLCTNKNGMRRDRLERLILDSLKARVDAA